MDTPGINNDGAGFDLRDQIFDTATTADVVSSSFTAEQQETSQLPYPAPPNGSHLVNNRLLDLRDQTPDFLSLSVSATTTSDVDTTGGLSDSQTALQLHFDVSASGLPNFLGCKQSLPTCLNLSAWRTELTDYSDKEVCDFMEFGWPIGYNSSCFPQTSQRNHPSATAYPDHVATYISKELEYGALRGPFTTPPFPMFQTSPLMTCEKRDSDSRRVIMDLSFPHGYSVNDGIPKDSYLGEPMALTYAKVDDLVQLVLRKQHPLIWKLDLKRAFRQIPCDPLDYPLLGIFWDSQFYFDTAIPFGIRTGSFFCQRMTNALAHMMHSRGHQLVNYIDDLASGGEPDEAWAGFNDLQALIPELGLSVADDKTCPPSERMVFLGIEFNLKDRLLQIPLKKLGEIWSLLLTWKQRRRASKRQLQSLLGKLHFISQCVKPARLFLARMLDQLRSCPEHGYTDLTDDFMRDVSWFLCFLPQYNGISLMCHTDMNVSGQQIFIDSCLTGCGAINEDEFYHTVFPDFVLDRSHTIAHLEFLNLVIASKLWAPAWRGLRVIFRCDNAACCSVLNTGRGKDPFLLQCAREVWLLSARHDCIITAQHVPGDNNVLSDALSRWHLDQKYQQLFLENTSGRQLRERFVDPYLFKLISTL